MIAALADCSVEAELIDGLTGVWTPERRKIGSIGVHVNRGITTHGFAINVNNDLQPFEWIVPCGIEACRMTSVTARAGRRAGPGRLRDHRPRPLRRGLRAGAGRGGRRGALRALFGSRGACRDGGGATVGPSGSRDDTRRAHPRHALARAPGRHAGGRGAPLPRPQAAVAEGPGPGRAHLPAPQVDDPRGEPAHGLRGGQLPQRRRVLGARHRDLHDPRRRLHAPLRLLQRPDGQADLERPARADARGGDR